MRWSVWWQLVIALQVHCFAQAPPTVCQDESCHCDAFTRVICNCANDYDEVTLRPDGAYRVPVTTTAIIIQGCARVYFLEGTAKDLIQLRSVELNNVRHVYFKQRSLAWSPYSPAVELSNPGLRISIKNSTINEIDSYAIKGRIDEIHISTSRINSLQSYAFSSLQGVNKIELIDNTFDNIAMHAFKKFSTHSFYLKGGTIRSLPSRFLADIEVANLFSMDGVTVKHLSSLAFLINGPTRVLIERNWIENLDGDGFHIVSNGPITFRNNTIISVRKGAFLGFSAALETTSVSGKQELLIDNNTMSDVMPSSLMYNGSRLTLRVEGLNLNRSCACELGQEWRALLAEQGGALNCWYGLEDRYVSIPTYVDTRCGQFKQNFWIFILVGVIFIVLIGVVVVFFIVKRENEKKKKLQIVMPDAKTYRETEFHIVVERAELLTTDL